MKVISKRLLNRGSQAQNSEKPKLKPKQAVKKYYEVEAEAESIKTAFKKSKGEPKPTIFECLEAEAGLEASIFTKSPASGSRSRSRLPTQPWWLIGQTAYNTWQVSPRVLMSASH